MPQPARKSTTTARRRPAKRRDTVSAQAPKRTQRERLIDAMIELAAQSGYQGVSIAQISSRAGVSSATFYEQFDDKEDCLLAAYQAASGAGVRADADRRRGSATGRTPHARRSTPLAGGLQSDPDAGRLLFVEALAGGPRMREERRRVLGAFERRVAGVPRQRAGDRQTPRHSRRRR